MTIDIDAKAKALVDAILAEPATDHDIDVVQRQLGRYPRGMVAVGADAYAGVRSPSSPGPCCPAAYHFPPPAT